MDSHIEDDTGVYNDGVGAHEAKHVGPDEISQRFSQKEWLAAEKKCTENEKKVLLALIALGNGTYEQLKTSDSFVLGNDLYLFVRHLLLNETFQLVTPLEETKNETNNDDTIKKKGKGKPKPGSAKAQSTSNKKGKEIALENSKTTTIKIVSEVLSTFSKSVFRPHDAFNKQYVEVKGIGLMYAAWFLVTNAHLYRKKSLLPFTLGVIVAIQRFINVCKEYRGKSMLNTTELTSVSSQIIIDIQKWFDKLITIYPFNGFVICDYAPELIMSTDHDIAIPKLGVKPRKHQFDLYESILSYFNDGFTFIYNPMIGLGKTSSAVEVASFVKSKRNTEGYQNLQLIFACNMMSVRDQVANICYNTNIGFAIGSYDKNEGYRITKHNMCKKDTDVIVVIASPEIAYLILTDTSKDDVLGKSSDRYILFLDEPTVGADIENSQSIRDNVALMTVCPKWTIYSSATFPTIDSISPIVKHIKTRYPDSHIETVYSPEIQIGCNVKTYDNELVIPHLGSLTSLELNNVIESIKHCPFLGRAYTTDVARSIWKKMSDCGVEDIPNISEMFTNVDNLSSDKVRQFSMILLELLTHQTNDIIAEVCSSVITDKIVLDIEDDQSQKQDNVTSSSKNDDNDDDIFESEVDTTVDESVTSIDFNKIGTTQAFRFLNMTLIASPDPTRFVKTYFSKLLDDIKNSSIEKKGKNVGSIIKNLRTLLETYDQDLVNNRREIERLEKNTKNPEKLSELLSNMASPKIKFPPECQINTSEHIEKYASNHITKIVKRFMRNPINLENLPVTEFVIEDDLVLLLMSGVGIYSANHYDKVYTQTVLDLASDGKLAYLVADGSICYGTNYPINRVFITNEFAHIHSMNTIFQLMGRAGRVGKSWIAEAFVTNEIALKIINYTKSANETNIEAINMCKIFTNILAEKRRKMMAKLSEIESANKPKEIVKNTGKIEVIYNKKNETTERTPERTPSIVSIASIINEQKSSSTSTTHNVATISESDHLGKSYTSGTKYHARVSSNYDNKEEHFTSKPNDRYNSNNSNNSNNYNRRNSDNGERGSYNGANGGRGSYSGASGGRGSYSGTSSYNRSSRQTGSSSATGSDDTWRT